MPTFFNEAELTPEQKARWDYAITEYKRVQDANAERNFANLTDADRASYLEQGAKTDLEIRAAVKEMAGLMGNSPGHSKSALFARLLNGKEALPFPPPRAHSYPWYSVIEEPGWHRARLDGSAARDGEAANSCLGINQSRWEIKSLNQSAQRLLDLDTVLKKTAKPDPTSEYSNL